MHGFRIVLNDRQRGPQGGNPPDQVAGPVVRLGAVQGRFGSLELLLDGGMLVRDVSNNAEAYGHPQRGPGIQHRLGSDASQSAAPGSPRHGSAGAPPPRR